MDNRNRTGLNRKTVDSLAGLPEADSLLKGLKGTGS